jgi:hypothetical protein
MIMNLKIQVEEAKRTEEALKNQLEEKEKIKETLEEEIISLRKELHKKEMQQNITKRLDEIISRQIP